VSLLAIRGPNNTQVNNLLRTYPTAFTAWRTELRRSAARICYEQRQAIFRAKRPNSYRHLERHHFQQHDKEDKLAIPEPRLIRADLS